MSATDPPLWAREACDLSAALHAGRVRAPELLEACLERIDDVDPALNAIVALNDTARAQAAASDARLRAGTPLGPLDGLPLLVKDNLVTADMPSTWGSPLFAATRWPDDELPVARLRAAGAVMLGKTNVPEFTLEGVTDNELFGATRNPWNTALTPGGSSGGSVAALAAGMAPLGIGTDGGGSIRRPAAYTGLVGLKPSIGRVARGGGFPPLLLDMEVVGPITRSVRDAALLLDALAGPDPRDHRSLRWPATGALAGVETPTGPLRVLAVARIGDAPVEPAIVAGFERFVDGLRTLGHRVRSGPLPFSIDTLNARWPAIGAIGLAALRAARNDWSGRVAARFDEMADSAGDGATLWSLLSLIDDLRNAACTAFGDYDLIVTPSCAAQPWPVDRRWPGTIDGRPTGPRGPAVYSGWVNAVGHPAVSVPLRGGDGAGLPLGMQIVGPAGGEVLLLQVARALERAGVTGFEWPPSGTARPRPAGDRNR